MFREGRHSLSSFSIFIKRSALYAERNTLLHVWRLLCVWLCRESGVEKSKPTFYYNGTRSIKAIYTRHYEYWIPCCASFHWNISEAIIFYSFFNKLTLSLLTWITLWEKFDNGTICNNGTEIVFSQDCWFINTKGSNYWKPIKVGWIKVKYK